jgi:yecA family protein
VRIIGLMIRRFNEISRMFDDNGTGFALLLYAQEVGKETRWNGEAWCAGFIDAVDLSFGDWQPLFDDEFSGFNLRLRH